MQYCLECKKLVPKDHAHKERQKAALGLGNMDHKVVSFGLKFPKRGGPRIITIVRPIREILRPMKIPDSYDLRNVDGENLCPPVVDQGSEGSCTGHGVYLAQGTMERIADEWVEDASRRMVYEDAKHRGGISEGAYMSDIVAAMLEDGNCRDHYEPYTADDPDRVGVWPPIGPDSLMDAQNWKVQTVYEIHTDPNPIEALQLYIMQYGAPDLGTPWTQSWMDNWVSGWLPIPTAKDSLLGGHSWGIIGWFYKNSILYFIAQNSWGTTNLLGGYFYFPAATFVCTNWQAVGGWEGYAFQNAKSIPCPEGQHYDFDLDECMDDNSGPQPTECDKQYASDIDACDSKFLENQDIWGWIYCIFTAIITYVECAWGKSFKVSKKLTYTGSGKTKKKKMTITITELKK
jgi:hypothetical protein